MLTDCNLITATALLVNVLSAFIGGLLGGSIIGVAAVAWSRSQSQQGQRDKFDAD